MLGNFECPDIVPPLTLLIKDPDENQVPMPISSNRNEDQVMMLMPVQNRKMQSVSKPSFSAGKREAKSNSPRYAYYKTKMISPDQEIFSISEKRKVKRRMCTEILMMKSTPTNSQMMIRLK